MKYLALALVLGAASVSLAGCHADAGIDIKKSSADQHAQVANA